MLKNEGLRVRTKIYTKKDGGTNYYERGYGGSDSKAVWIFTEILLDRKGNESQRRSFIGHYPMDKKTFEKIKNALKPCVVEFMDGTDESSIFMFVGVWDNEQFGRHKFYVPIKE